MLQPASPVYLSPHFSLAEFTASRSAAVRGWPNDPDPNSRLNLGFMALVMEDIRTLLGERPITVTSGYRTPLLNQLEKGSRNSAHMLGLACDFIAPRYGTPLDICRSIATSTLMPRIDQLIFEGTWVHVGLAATGKAPRAQVLTAKFTPGSKTVYLPGLPQ